MKKKGLLSSILTIALCLSLIGGSTFALFTSNSNVDIAVTSGGVELNASVDMSGLKTYSLNQPQAMGKFAAGGSAALINGALIFNKIVPGDRAEFPISVINRSDIDVQYRVVVNVEGELANGLVITAELNGKTYDLVNPLAMNYADKTQWFFWDAETGASRNQINMTIELPKTAGNEYQKKSAVISVTVEAVQANAEIWDGESVDTSWYADYGTAYYIKTGAQLAGLAQLAATENFKGKTVTLMNDINLNNLPWNPINDFEGIFDGNGHTISGLFIDMPTTNKVGLFGISNYSVAATVKNLTVDGAFVRGLGHVAVIWGSGNGTVIENCTVRNATVIATEKRTGALIGYVINDGRSYNTQIDNNVVENVTVYTTTTSFSQAYDIAIGTANNAGGAHDNEPSWNVTESTNTIINSELIIADRVIVDIADFFAFAAEVNGGDDYAGKTVVLHNDINLRNILWTPIGVNGTLFNGTFNGQGHTVSNLYVKNNVKDAAGLFGHVRGTIKNLNVENANVISAYKVAVIVGDIYGFVDNCHVKNAIVEAQPTLKAGVYDEGNNAGVIVGYLAEGSTATGRVYTVTNCSVENAVVAAYRDLGAIAGTAQKETKIADCTVKNVSLAYLAVYPYNGDKENQNVGEIAGRVLGTALIENNTVSNVKTDIYLTRPVDELIAGNGYTTITKPGTYEIEENMFLYDKLLIAYNSTLKGDITINGNGNILTYNDVAGVFDVSYSEFEYDYKGFVLYANGTKDAPSLITVNDLTILSNLPTIYLGRYDEKGTRYNVGAHPSQYYLENVRILNLENDYVQGVGVTSSVVLFGEATFKNCQMIGSYDLENPEADNSDVILHNYSRLTLDGGEYGKINATKQIWTQLTVKDAVVGTIDAKCSTSSSFKDGKLTITGTSQVGTVNIHRAGATVIIDADAVVDTLSLPADMVAANVVINGTVNHLLVGGIETTYEAWVAAVNG